MGFLLNPYQFAAGAASAANYLPYPVLHDTGTGWQDAGAPTSSLPDHIENDLLLMIVNTANQSISTPSGWTAWTEGLVGSGTAGGADAVGLQIFYKIAGASESAPSIDDSGDHTVGRIYAISGVDTADPIGNVASGTEAVATTSFTYPAITVQTAGNAVLFVGSHEWSSTQTERFDPPTNSNLTLRQNLPGVGGTVGNGGGFNGFLFHSEAAVSIGTTAGTINVASVLAFGTIEIKGNGTGTVPYIAGISNFSRTSGTPSLTLPSNVNTDDILWLFYQNQNDGTPATPTGWTAKGDAQDAAVGLYTFWRRADGTANDTPTLDDAGAFNAAGIIVVRGCTTSGDPFDQYSITTQGSGSNTVTFAEVTTTVDGCLILNWMSNDRDQTGALLNSYTESANTQEGFYMDYTAAGWISFGGGGHGAGAAIMATAGATGQATGGTDGNFSSKVIVTAAFAPA